MAIADIEDLKPLRCWTVKNDWRIEVERVSQDNSLLNGNANELKSGSPCCIASDVLEYLLAHYRTCYWRPS